MAHPVIDERLGAHLPKELLKDKHVKFLLASTKEDDSTLHFLKVSGIFWTLTALDLLNSLNLIDKNAIVDFVLQCQKSDGGFAPAPNHDSHLLHTLSALQILSLLESMDKINTEAVYRYICNLQQPDGSFCGDYWGEIDTRFSFCAVASLHLLGKTSVNEPGLINFESCASYLEKCQNLDGGFGTRPGSESHAGQAYCVIGALSLLHQLHRLNLDRAAWWLAERQLPSGGLNGRPEKRPDVCYSWWAVASLTILGRVSWIKASDLAQFILAAQDDQLGGIADRPGNYADPFHTLFGLAGLSLMAQHHPEFSDNMLLNVSEETDPIIFAVQETKEILKPINPALCMPEYILNQMGISVQILH